MKDVILNPNLTSDQQSLTLHFVLKDPELSSIIKNASVSISLSQYVCFDRLVGVLVKMCVQWHYSWLVAKWLRVPKCSFVQVVLWNNHSFKRILRIHVIQTLLACHKCQYVVINLFQFSLQTMTLKTSCDASIMPSINLLIDTFLMQGLLLYNIFS